MPQLKDAAGVATHYIDTGSGTPTLILHGGLEDGEAWQFFIDALASAGRRVLAPDRRGHGRTPDVPGPYTYNTMADETIAFLEQVVDGPADLIGYSDGGIVALLVAQRRADLVRRLVAISANYEAHGIVITMRERMANADPDADRFEQLRADYANKSPDDPTNWPAFLAKVVDMGLDGAGHDLDELHSINLPVLLVAADDDVVDLHYTVDQHLALPDAQLAVLPGTSHLLAHEKPELLLRVLGEFLNAEPVERLMPMRTPTPGPIRQRRVLRSPNTMPSAPDLLGAPRPMLRGGSVHRAGGSWRYMTRWPWGHPRRSRTPCRLRAGASGVLATVGADPARNGKGVDAAPVPRRAGSV